MRSALPFSIPLTMLALACGEEPSSSSIVELFSAPGLSAVSAPGLDGDRVFVPKSQAPGRVVVLDATSGAERFAFDAFASVFPPRAVHGRIAVVSVLGRLGLYASDGSSLTVPGPAFGRTTRLETSGSTLRLGTASGMLLGVDGEGQTLFEAALEGAALSPLAVTADGRAFVATDFGRLYGFDANGNEDLRLELPTPVTGPVVSGAGPALISGSELRAYDPSGALRFSVPGLGGFQGLVAASDGALIAWSTGGNLVSARADGSVRFSASVREGLTHAPVALAAGSLALFTANGQAILMDSQGTILNEMSLGTVPSGQPIGRAAGGRRVYVPLDDRLVGLSFNAPE